MAAIFKIYLILLEIGVLGMIFDFIDTLLWATVDVIKDKRKEMKKASSVNRRRKVHHKTKFGV